MDFRILGPLEVIENGHALDLGGQKQRTLLTVLLLRANEVVSTDRLIEALWQDEPPGTSHKALQVYVSGLRKVVGRERLETRSPGYLLRVATGELDLGRFRSLRDEHRFQEALSEWRGPVLADFASERFAQGEIARLEAERLLCLEARIEQDLAAGRHLELVGELEGLVREHPLREGLRGQLMVALYRSGRQAEALAVYQEARGVLLEDLGIDPSRELRDLHQAILNQDPGLERSPSPDDSPGAPTGTVTFLFSDVAGSTRLLRELGQESYADALVGYQAVVRERCRGHGGYEIDTQGDAFFFSFARARDAALAAADCQRGLDVHAWPDGARLRARIGLHTGEARLKDGRYVGLSVHRAARICSLARGGQVLCSSATASVLEDEEIEALSLRALGEYPLKDFDQPVALYELEGPGLEPGLPPPEGRSGEPPVEPSRGLVGRETELAELVAGLDDAVAGRGRLFLLVGEPGIGKSRLAEELVGRARALSVRTLVGRCWEAGGAPAYWPWVQSMRAYVRDAEPDALRAQLGPGAAELAQLLPELRDLFPDLGEPPAVESESARFRLFEAAASFLRSASRARPVLLVLDDLHAADEPSLLLLQFVAREVGDSRLLVVGACRNVDPTPNDRLTAALTELDRESTTRILALAGLGTDDVARFIELVAGEQPSDELVATVYGETDGNPLFVGEIARLLAEEGRLDDAGEGRFAVPQSVRDVISRRLRHLSEECVRVLVLASVLGREFTLAGLARMADVSEDALLDTLDEAMEARVVSDVPGSPGRLRFAHVLIRDTLYEGLTTARRVRLHRLAVDVLEAEGGTAVAALAHHAIAGSDFERARVYATRAADRALGLLAYEEAARLYESALETLELAAPGDEEARCDLLLALADARFRAGESSAAKETFLEAAGIARRLGLARQLARAAAGYGGRIVWARTSADNRLVPLLEEALAALGESDAELRIMLLARLAGALRDEPSRDRRDALSSEALDLARRTGNPAALAYALDARAHAIIAPDTLAECLALSGEFRDVMVRTADRERLVAAHMLRLHAQLLVGDFAAAESSLEAAVLIAEELRQPAQLWLLTANQALLALATGKLVEAETLMEAALALGVRAQPEQAIPHDRIQRYTLCDFRGRLEEAEPAMQDLVALFPARPVFRCALAHLHARIGRRAEAERALAELASDDVAALPFDQEWLYAMSLLAETCVLVGDTRVAPVLYRRLEPWWALNAVDVAEGFRGSASRSLGQLAALLGRPDDAVGHLEHALGMNERMGARPWLALTQQDLAAALRARGDPGDAERAGELESEARRAAEELGLAGYFSDITQTPSHSAGAGSSSILRQRST